MRAVASGQHGIAPLLCSKDASIRLLGNKPLYKAIPVTSVGTYVCYWHIGSVRQQRWWQLAQHKSLVLCLSPWWHLALGLVALRAGALSSFPAAPMSVV